METPKSKGGKKNKGLIAEQLKKVTKRMDDKAKESEKMEKPEIVKAEKPEKAAKPEVAEKQPVEKKPEVQVEEPKVEKKAAIAPKPSITDNPLTQQPVKREGKEYTKPIFKGDIPNRAPVPQFQRPEIKLGEDIPKDIPIPEDKKPKAEKPGDTTMATRPSVSGSDNPPIKPDVINTPTGDGGKNQKKYSKQLAELFIFAHNILWSQIGGACLMTDEKLDKKITKGQIDPRILEMEIGGGKTVRFLIDEYNDKINEITGENEEYDAKLLPAITALFVEKGWGLTDQQYAIFLIIMEDITRASDIFRTRNIFMGQLRQLSQQLIQSYGQASPNVKRQGTITPPEQPGRQQTEEITPEPIKPEKKKTGKNKEIPEAVIMPANTIDDDTAKMIADKEKHTDTIEE